MKLNRFASLALLVVTPGLAHCEIVEVPPPQAPEPAPPAPAPGDQGGAGQAAAESYDDNDPSALTDFHSALDSYGTWVDDPTYGTVWVPSSSAVGADFTPYATAGRWTYDNDYVWVSDYPWGWAPFHYGRWVFVDGRGWSWIPGRAYRGAWVTWGVDDGYGYAGWYPLAPAFVWMHGVAVGYTGVVAPRWNYVRRGEIFSPAVGTRVITGPAAVSVGARVRPFTPATPGVAGPPPSRFGYSENQVPHPAPGAIGRAQQFARPSTATRLGARPPARVSANPGINDGRIFRGNGPVAARVEANGRYNQPGDDRARYANVHPVHANVVPRGRPGPQPQVRRAAPASVPRFNGSRGGGGHHR